MKNIAVWKEFCPKFSSIFLIWKLIEKRFQDLFPLLLYFAVNTLSWIQWEIAEKRKFFQKVVIDLDGILTLFSDTNITV